MGIFPAPVVTQQGPLTVVMGITVIAAYNFEKIEVGQMLPSTVSLYFTLLHFDECTTLFFRTKIIMFV